MQLNMCLVEEDVLIVVPIETFSRDSFIFFRLDF